MPWHYSLDAHLDGTLRDSIKIVDLEPQQQSVAIWFIRRIANASVVVLDVEMMELQN